VLLIFVLLAGPAIVILQLLSGSILHHLQKAKAEPIYGSGVIMRRRAVTNAHKTHHDTKHLTEESDANLDCADASDFSYVDQLSLDDDHQSDLVPEISESSFMGPMYLDSASSLRKSIDNIVWDSFSAPSITSSEKNSTSILDLTGEKTELFAFSDVTFSESLSRGSIYFMPNSTPSSVAKGDLRDRKIGTSL